jgi:solute carrier family 25 uncoupling protein 8/9
VRCLLRQGLGAGFVAVCVGSPVDVVKSRVMGDKTVRATGPSACAVRCPARFVRAAAGR